MSEPPEQSPGGSQILRHTKREGTWPITAGDGPMIEAISGHIAQYIGEPYTVYHEIASTDVHVDVHIVTPTQDRGYFTLVTSGMSERPMTVPAGTDASPYAEIVAHLPPDWKLDYEDLKQEENYWPIRLMKVLARLPHEYGTWLGYGHTLPHGDPETPYASNTSFTGVLMLQPILTPTDFHELKLPDRTIAFLAAVPLYPLEMDHKLKFGGWFNDNRTGLMDRFEENVSVRELYVITNGRPCAVRPVPATGPDLALPNGAVAKGRTGEPEPSRPRPGTEPAAHGLLAAVCGALILSLVVGLPAYFAELPYYQSIAVHSAVRPEMLAALTAASYLIVTLPVGAVAGFFGWQRFRNRSSHDGRS